MPAKNLANCVINYWPYECNKKTILQRLFLLSKNAFITFHVKSSMTVSEMNGHHTRIYIYVWRFSKERKKPKDLRWPLKSWSFEIFKILKLKIVSPRTRRNSGNLFLCFVYLFVCLLVLLFQYSSILLFECLFDLFFTI